MALDQTGNAIPAPSFTQTDETTDPEILYSTAGFTQKGVTLLAGAGVLPAGCAVGRVTASKLWTVYDNGASDGTEVCRGILRKAVDTGTDANGEVFLGNIVLAGILKNAELSGVDANAITDLGARVDSVLGTFSFGH